MPKYEWKLGEEVFWAALISAGVFVFEIASQFNEDVFSDWETWGRAAVAGLIRATAIGGLNAIRRLRG